MTELKRTTSHDPDFQQLIVLLDQYLWSLYGDLQATYHEFNHMGLIDTVVIAYLDGDAAGCACFKQLDTQTAELKRMFVKDEYRGKGIASAIISELEQWAAELGHTSMVLETGSEQIEAVHLYRKQRYQLTENYGQYVGMLTSMCMRKSLQDPIA